MTAVCHGLPMDTDPPAETNLYRSPALPDCGAAVSVAAPSEGNSGNVFAVPYIQFFKEQAREFASLACIGTEFGFCTDLLFKIHKLFYFL